MSVSQTSMLLQGKKTYAEVANPFVSALDNGLVSSTENGDFALTSKGMAHRQKSRGERGGALTALDQQLVGSRPEMRSVSSAPAFHLRNPKVTKANLAHKKKKVGTKEGITRVRLEKMMDDVIQEGMELECLPEQMVDLVVLAFHVRDIDHGKGERTIFYWMMVKLLNHLPESLVGKLLSRIVEYGSYADLPRLAEIAYTDGNKGTSKKLYDMLVSFHSESIQANLDLDVKNRNLAPKWATRIDSHFDKTCHFGKSCAKYLFPVEIEKGTDPKTVGIMLGNTYKRYRKLCSELTKETCVETAMCAKNWKWVGDNLKKVTGKAQYKYRKAFMDEILYGPNKGQRRNPDDEERSYLRMKLEEATQRAIENPEEGIIKGGKTLQAYEIVKVYLDGKPQDATLEAQWKSIVYEITAPRVWAEKLSNILLNLDANQVPNRTKDTSESALFLRNKVVSSLEKSGNTTQLEILGKILESFKTQSVINKVEALELVQDWDRASRVFDGDVSIVDTSGSMSGTPMEVAISLGILVAECQTDTSPWRNRCVTFSENPAWHMMTGTTLYDKVSALKMENRWGGSTNFGKTMNMILAFCKEHQVEEKFLPKRLWCFTDMQFDSADNASSGYYGYRQNQNQDTNDKWQTAFVKAQRAFKELGYSQAPSLTFWNIRASNGTTQCQSDDKGVTTYGGFSQNLFKSVVFGKVVDVREETPWDRLKTTLDGDRYLPIREMLSETREGILANYTLVRQEVVEPAEENNSDDEWDILE